MKDEIKEILTISGRYITNDEKGLILDYITNLQQKNETLKATIKYLKETGSIIRDFQNFQDYKTRCEETSELLSREYWLNEHEHNDDVVDMALNILQGSDKE